MSRKDSLQIGTTKIVFYSTFWLFWHIPWPNCGIPLSRYLAARRRPCVSKESISCTRHQKTKLFSKDNIERYSIFSKIQGDIIVLISLFLCSEVSFTYFYVPTFSFFRLKQIRSHTGET